MSNNKNIGVITEQGFPVGEGLGFTPIDEEKELKSNAEKDSKKEDK